MQGQRFIEGMPVYDAAGERLGALHEYYMQGGYLVVQKGFLFRKDLYIPVNAIGRSDADGIYLQLYKDDLEDGRYDNPPAGGATGVEDYVQTTTMVDTATPRSQAGQATQADDTISVPVYEEELVAGKREEEIGRVHLHKDVVEEQQTVNVPLQQEHVTVERVPMSGQVDPTTVRDAFAEQDLDVPVMGEEAVVGKQVRAVEEVRPRGQQSHGANRP